MGGMQQPQPAGTGATGAEAAAALAEIQRRQEHVIKAVLVPGWYWWAMAAGMVAIGAARDSGDLLAQAITIPLAALVMAGLTGAMIPAVRHRVQVHSATQPDARGAAAIFGLILLVDGAILGTAASLHAARFPYPGTIGTRRRSCRDRDRRAAGEPVPEQAHAKPGPAANERRAGGRRHSMSTARFDVLIHAPTRLAIVSLLAAAQWADFKYIRDELGLSDSALSKQLSTLESAGYVEIRKGFVGKRPRTSASLSAARPPGIRAACGGPPANHCQVTAGCRRRAGR